MKLMTLRFAAVLLPIFLAACGNDANPSNSTSLRTGVFLDSPVQGLGFHGSLTSAPSGLTNAAGQFQYIAGDTVTFRIGSLVLGSALGRSTITPLTLVPGATSVSDNRVTNIAVLLQSLDTDRNPNNGITLPAAAATAAANHPVNLAQTANNFHQSPELTALIREANGDTRNPVPPAQAQAHLQQTTGGSNGGGNNGGGTCTPTSIDVTPATASKAVSDTQPFSVESVCVNGTRTALNSGVTWTSSNTAIATVDAAGLATAVAVGAADITASALNFTDKAVFTVTAVAATLDSITVSPAIDSLVVGGTRQYSASGSFSDGSTQNLSNVTWTSSVPAIASITPSGMANALAAGVTTISASRDGKTGNAQLAVTVPPPPALPFKVGTGQASHDPIGRVCFGSGSMCSRSADPSTQPNAIRDPLISKATAITGGNGETLIVVTTTNIGYFLAYKPEQGGLNGIYDVRLRIAKITGVPSTNIVVVSDHSHNGPDTIGIWGGVSAEYLKITADAVVEAAVEAYESRRDAFLKVAAVNQNETPLANVPRLDSSYDTPPGNDPTKGNPYNEFRMLIANDAETGDRILTFVNYAPHATVTNGDTFDGEYRLTGDWAAWMPQEAERRFGGMGLATIGTVGSTDWNKSGNIEQREAEARARLNRLMDAATDALQNVTGNTVGVDSVFIRESMTQPALLLNYKLGLDHNLQGVSPVTDATNGRDLRIDRSPLPPFLTGTVVGTYVSAVRIGDVFLSTFPGEPFGELDFALKDAGRVSGARAHFLLGGANDFFGYMVKNFETYQQTAATGALWIAGCPEEDFAKQIGLRHEDEGACSDHWSLMVSPTIGSHIVCTLQNSASALGFTVANGDPECPVLTALDGLAAPPEFDDALLGPVYDPLLGNTLEARQAAVEQARDLAEQCVGTGAPMDLCLALSEGARQAEIYLGAEPAAGGVTPPTGAARAGVASKDASWHLGASAGQFANSGAGIARNAGFDPYGHSTRKVGADILGTRIHTRALVVEGSNGQRVAVVANDLYLAQDLLQRRTAQKLVEHDLTAGLTGGVVTGITGANLAMTSSHSHTSPFYSTPGWGTWIFQDVFDLRFYEYMATQQAEAIIEAASNLKPVRMGGATVKSNDITGHTYGPKGPPNDSRDGTPAGQPYEYTTQQVTVLSFDDITNPAQPAPLANWVIFGVHPEWVWGEEIVNGDVTHATMRMLDRETGAMTVMSQRETGSSGPHKDTRVHPVQDRREFQESGPSGTDRGARLLTNSIKKALNDLKNNTKEIPSQFAAYQTNFPVASVSQRFAPPATRPYPGVSNCNSDRVFEGDVGIPILGFPDCFYDHTEFTDVVTEPFLAALPYSSTQLRDDLIAAGVPIPVSYSASTLTAVEETAAVHLQVFKLGSVVATMSPSEQFTSGALNLASRLDKVPNNLWHGFDWACRLAADHPVRVGEAASVTRHCNAQNAAYPDLGRGIPGSVDGTPMAKVRAQIHNSAAGWELDPIYMFNNEDPTPLMTLGSEAEPATPADIKGNFTHEEFTSSGYDLVITVGMVNDYWGYMPEYRDYRSFDHYRKALNGLGPHGADFLNTRLARMAAQLNGSSKELPTNPLDTFFQAESARAEATAQMLGETARAYTTIYDATVPADGGTAGITQEPAMVVPRFSAAVLKFIGGSNYSGSPNVRVERLLSTNPDVWETYGTQDGELQLQLQFLPAAISEAAELPVAGEGIGFALPDPAAYAMWRAGLFEWVWTATFEAFVSELDNLGARPRATPAGQYRFVVDGLKRGMTALEPYSFTSAAFTVVPWNGITVEGLRVEADRTVSFALGPVGEHRTFRDGMGTDAGQFTIGASEETYVVGPIDYPDSYTGGISWITNERQLNRDGSRESGGHQQYCVRCTFRPWADAAEVASATVTVRGAENSIRTLPATRNGNRWVTAGSLVEGETASIEIGGIVDQYGETNGQAYVAGVNRAPVADAGADISVAKDSAVVLNGSASRDLDRDAITYAWTQIPVATVVLASANTARPSFTAPDAAGVLMFRLTVTDSVGVSHSDDVTVTVTDGGTPPPGPAPFNICDPVTGDYCLRDIPGIGNALADALGMLLGDGAPAPPGAGGELPSSDGLLQTPLMPAEEASCAPDNSGVFVAYVGSLHEHSGYSDGAVGTTPASYFAQGKSLGLSFMGSTEHSDSALVPVTTSEDCASENFADCVSPMPSPENPVAPVTKWDLTLQQARDASAENFTAFRGFEWTSDRFGHINVYFSRNDFNAKTTEGYTLSMESFYNWFKTMPAAGGGSDGLLVFNHPGREDMIEGSLPNTDPAYAFNDFQYRADADLRAVGVEVFGKGGDAYDTDNNAPAGGWYAYALDKGWHLGPVGAEDEHGTDWGKPNRAKTMLLARDRSEGALREAMLARRFYALAQNKNTLRLTYTADGQPMGSRLNRVAGATVPISATLTGGTGTIELVGKGGVSVPCPQVLGSISCSVPVPASTEGERWYYVRVKQGNAPVAYTAPVWIRSSGVYPACGEWLAGDLHVHSTYSHDSYGGPDEVAGPLNEIVPATRDFIPGDTNTGPEEFYVYGHSVRNQFRIAALRGLDYLAITDHNDIRSHSDPGRGAMGLIHLPSYENSLDGHAQMHGAKQVYPHGAGAAAIDAMAWQLRGDGGVFQINHPADANANPYPDNLGWEYGFDVVPDTIEVWNIGVRAYQAPFPSYTNNDASTQFWEDFLNRGHKVGATGGSDNHWVTLTGVAGAGQPTTWVFAKERSARGLLAGLREGRTFISHQPPLMGGPRVLIEADRDDDGVFESVQGDTVPATAALRVRVQGAPGALVRLYHGTGALSGSQFVESELPVMALDAVVAFDVPTGARKWLRAEVLMPDGAEARVMAQPLCDALGSLGEMGFPEDTGTTYCRNKLAVLAMTSAIYLQP